MACGPVSAGHTESPAVAHPSIRTAGFLPLCGGLMSELSTVCPATGKPLSLGFQIDSRNLAKVWFSSVCSDCPHCGQKHLIKVREAYVEAVLSDRQLRTDFEPRPKAGNGQYGRRTMR